MTVTYVFLPHVPVNEKATKVCNPDRINEFSKQNTTESIARIKRNRTKRKRNGGSVEKQFIRVQRKSLQRVKNRNANDYKSCMGHSSSCLFNPCTVRGIKVVELGNYTGHSLHATLLNIYFVFFFSF